MSGSWSRRALRWAEEIFSTSLNIFGPGSGPAQQQASLPHGRLRQCWRQDSGGHFRGLLHLRSETGDSRNVCFVIFIATPFTWFQVPIDALLSNKTFCFFSHTIKAQPDNMDLLDAMLEKNVRSQNLTSSVWNTIPDWNEPSVANVTTNTQPTAGVLTMRRWWMPRDKEL